MDVIVPMAQILTPKMSLAGQMQWQSLIKVLLEIETICKKKNYPNEEGTQLIIKIIQVLRPEICERVETVKKVAQKTTNLSKIDKITRNSLRASGSEDNKTWSRETL